MDRLETRATESSLWLLLTRGLSILPVSQSGVPPRRPIADLAKSKRRGRILGLEELNSKD